MRLIWVVRAIGLISLGGAVLAALSWLNTDKLLTPILSKEVAISIDKTESLIFTPGRETSNRHYSIQLGAENKSRSTTSCVDAKLSDLEWSIAPSNSIESWSNLSSPKSSCSSRDQLTVIGFAIPSLKPYTDYSLRLRRAGKSQSENEIKVNVSVQLEDGIEVHYLLMDEALAELSGAGLLLISFTCFMVDIFKHHLLRASR